MVKLPTLSTGLIIAGAYADKVRRTLFAQLRDRIKQGEITNQEVAKAAGELNRIIYEILVNKLRIDKGDVVRIRIEYDITDGQVKWKYDTLRLEVFRRIPDEDVSTKVSEIIGRIEEILSKVVQYTVEKVLTTKLGDHIYWIKLGEKRVGAIIVTPLNGSAIVRGAVLDPSPVIIDRGRIEYKEGELDQAVSREIVEMLRVGRHAESSEVEEILKDIEALIEVEFKAKGKEAEKVEAWSRSEE